VSEASDPWVDPATVPELVEILSRGWLSKVRIFEGWCESRDRLLQVVSVNGRPLALARAAARATTGSPNPAFLRRGHWDHRAYVQAAWLDLSGDARWLSAQCRHVSLSIPLVWLRGQLEAGTSKRVITEAARLEMAALLRGDQDRYTMRREPAD
jgi:hypothetical protein